MSAPSSALRPSRGPSPRYTLLSPLGAGGMGIVHRAHDTLTGRLVAIKRPFSPDPCNQDLGFDARASLLREGAALSRLDHPNVVRLWETGVDELAIPFLVLELLEAPRSITRWASGRPLAPRLSALVQMFDALAHVHEAHLAHGDVKPSNVLVCDGPASPDVDRPRSPRVCLADFGLAADCDAPPVSADLDAPPPSSLAGAVLYMAPERMDRGVPTPASDLYAAGILAAEVLTGADPRARTGPRTTLSSLRDFGTTWLDHLVRDFDLDGAATSLLRSLLSKDPSGRCSAHEAASRLGAPLTSHR